MVGAPAACQRLRAVFGRPHAGPCPLPSYAEAPWSEDAGVPVTASAAGQIFGVSMAAKGAVASRETGEKGLFRQPVLAHLQRAAVGKKRRCPPPGRRSAAAGMVLELEGDQVGRLRESGQRIKIVP